MFSSLITFFAQISNFSSVFGGAKMILKRLVKRRLLTFSFYGRCKLAWRTMNQQRYLCPLEILLTIFFVQLVLFLVSHPLFFIYMFLTSFVYTIEVVWENSNTVTENN